MKYFKIMVVLLLIAKLAIMSSCDDDSDMTDPPNEVTEPSDSNTNILLIIADDLGKDALNGYAEGSQKPNTPHIDSIRNAGLTFSNFWVYPTCTPTRSSILTGKYGYRTNVKWAGDVLSTTETSLQKYINTETNNDYNTAIIGKWHLSGNNTSVNPESFGIDYYTGLIRGGVNDYFEWSLSSDGMNSTETSYITEFITDKSIEWIDQQTSPWFLWQAYTAPHTPFHLPPDHMHTQGILPAYTDEAEPMPYYLAAIEAMDFQIGRLLDSMSEQEKENTLIIFMGDNGTPGAVAQVPYSRRTVKGSLYQGGINVPMFVSGKEVSRSGIDDNLVSSTDLFATIAQVAGSNITEVHDSKSFKSLLTQNATIREFQYSEMNNGNDDIWTIRNSRYKLIVNANGSQEMYDMSNDPYENSNLLDATLSTMQQNNKNALEAELAIIRN